MKEERDLRTVKVYQSLIRPELVMGGEREPVMMTTLFVGITIFEGLVQTEWLAVALAVFCYSLLLFALRKMAKADPAMTKVWGRYMRYQSVYPARSSAFARRGFVKR